MLCLYKAVMSEMKPWVRKWELGILEAAAAGSLRGLKQTTACRTQFSHPQNATDTSHTFDNL